MFEGRVEMCYNEDYGTICDLGFGRLEAAVVCSQLGFSRIRKIYIRKVHAFIKYKSLIPDFDLTKLRMCS